jgi:hypothetical protein
MNKKLLFSVTTIGLLLFSSIGFSQTLELGTLQPFGSFAGSGAVTNSGTAEGDAGTNAGIISGAGFDTPGYTGTTYVNDATTIQARIDLLRVYIHLDDVFVTEPSTHLPAFGGGEILKPGVYSIGGAGSVAGDLTLDGEDDPNAFFIIKFEGAFTVGAGSKIMLTGGTRAANVFWISQGAISVAASSAMEGTLFAHPGAVTIGVNSTINGRLLTSEGAITIAAGGESTMPEGDSIIPIKCLGDCTPTDALNILGSLKDFALFTSVGAVANAATSGIVGDIGAHAGAISGFGTSTHTNKDGTTGNFFNADATTAKAVEDLDIMYNALMALSDTEETPHTPAFGLGETITSGVYSIAGAGSLAGTIILDGENNPDSYFVFRFAGAFSVAAQSRVILINGAKRCNVFWLGGAGVATGAVSIGTFTYMKGTVISHGGACTAGANSSIEGRMLSTGGAIGFSTGVIYNDTLCFEEPEVSDPEVALVKTAIVVGEGTAEAAINYTFVVRNTGNTTLTAIAVTDPMLSEISGSPITSLEPGESSTLTATYNITQEDINRGSVTNSALATAKDPDNNDITDKSGTTEDNDDDTITDLSKTPSITLVKTAIVAGTGTLGDVITYTFTVKNTGNTTLTAIAVTDPMILDLTGSPIASLEPGESSAIITGTYTVTQEDVDEGSVTNSALATAKDSDNNDITDKSGTTEENDDDTVTDLDQTPSIALVKLGTSENGNVGDEITYTFTVENTGNTSLSNVIVTDPMIGLIMTGNSIDTLAVGATSDAFTGTYIITQDDIDAGSVTNTALATAQDSEDNNITDVSGTANDNDDPTVITLDQTSTINLVKNAVVSGTGTLEDVITYIFTIRNTGNTTLTNVVITDPMLSVITGSPITSLAPGDATMAIGSYIITQADIDKGNVENTALATAQDPDGDDIEDVSGTDEDNDDKTITEFPVLPDFTPTVILDELGFLAGGDSKDFIVNISEVGGFKSEGPVQFDISKGASFDIEYGANNSSFNIDNTDWDVQDFPEFIRLTLKPQSEIGVGEFSAIGFKVTRGVDIPTQTTQPITVTITNGSGGDTQVFNNTYNTVIKAQ